MINRYEYARSDDGLFSKKSLDENVNLRSQLQICVLGLLLINIFFRKQERVLSTEVVGRFGASSISSF